MSDTSPVTPALADELALCERYLSLESLRLGERLQVAWQRDAAADTALVPPFLLQPLVENAVFHGIEPGVGPGTARDPRGRHDPDGVLRRSQRPHVLGCVCLARRLHWLGN